MKVPLKYKIFIPIYQVWFQNRRMKLKRERISISWPYSYDPQTQAFLTPVAASYTYPWMQPTTVSASANSLFPLPSQLCFAASTSNHSSLSASSISSSSSMKNHICRLWQSSATNDSGMYPRLAAVATTPKIQYGNNSEVDKISTTNFKRSNLSTINNGITSSFVDVQAMYFSQLQKYTQRRDLHHYPHEQQNGYKAFLAYDPFFSNGLSTLTQSFSSQSNYNTMMSSYPVCSLYDNARGVETEWITMNFYWGLIAKFRWGSRSYSFNYILVNMNKITMPVIKGTSYSLMFIAISK